MIQLDKLYALDKKGKIRVFEIELIDYPHECIVIQTSTGLLDGKNIHKLVRINSGKVNRTIEQQAELVATSKYNEKLNEGYKSYNTFARAYNMKLPPGFNKVPYTNNSIETNDMIEQVMEGVIWNTNRNWDPLPMLAEPVNKVKLKFPLIGQPKLDGVRDLSKLREPGNINSNLIMCSRGGKYYTGLIEIEKELKILFKAEDYYMMTDGELYKHGVTQNQISGEARRKKKDIFQEQWLEYHIYDLPVIGGSGYKQRKREEVRLELAKKYSHLKFVKFTESRWIHNYEEAKEYHDELVERGYEGLILRDPSAPYMFSFRDKCLLKYKAFVTEEFKCVGRTIQHNDISTFTLLFSNGEGQTFGARCKGSHALWKKYLNKPPIGRMMKIRYINRSAINNVPEKATVLPISDYDKWD